MKKTVFSRSAMVAFLAVVLLSIVAAPAVYAADDAAAPAPVWHYFGAALGLGLIVLGAALGIGKFAAAAAEGIARQPAADRIPGPSWQVVSAAGRGSQAANIRFASCRGIAWGH